MIDGACNSSRDLGRLQRCGRQGAANGAAIAALERARSLLFAETSHAHRQRTRANHGPRPLDTRATIQGGIRHQSDPLPHDATARSCGARSVATAHSQTPTLFVLDPADQRATATQLGGVTMVELAAFLERGSEASRRAPRCRPTRSLRAVTSCWRATSPGWRLRRTARRCVLRTTAGRNETAPSVLT